MQFSNLAEDRVAKLVKEARSLLQAEVVWKPEVTHGYGCGTFHLEGGCHVYVLLPTWLPRELVETILQQGEAVTSHHGKLEKCEWVVSILLRHNDATLFLSCAPEVS